MRCPCRKTTESRTFAECCEPYHRGILVAPTAEALMRSRYSAYVLKDGAYLAATWHPSTRPAHIDFNPGQTWMLLRILATHGNGDDATVEFDARSRIGGRSHVLHEVSRFVRENERWFYVDGVVT